MDSDCPFKIELRMEDGPGISYLLTNISDTVQEYINDWSHGMAPVMIAGWSGYHRLRLTIRRR